MPYPFYGVQVGAVPGVYEDWGDCEKQVKGFPKAVYKGFGTYEEALIFSKSTKGYKEDFVDPEEFAAFLEKYPEETDPLPPWD